MSDASLYRIDFDDINTGKRADSITRPLRAKMRLTLSDEVMRKSPHLRLVGIYQRHGDECRKRDGRVNRGRASIPPRRRLLGSGRPAATGEVVRQLRRRHPAVVRAPGGAAAPPRRRRAGQRRRAGLAQHRRGDRGRGAERIARCRSLLVQALRHMLKAEAWPLTRDAPSWRADAIDFRRQARRRFVALDAAEDRRRRPLCRRAGGAARDDGRPAAVAGARCLPGDAGRAAAPSHEQQETRPEKPLPRLSGALRCRWRNAKATDTW